MHSFEVSLGYESVDQNVLRSTLSYPNETSKECIQFLNKTLVRYLIIIIIYFDCGIMN
jgi:hypothetical protein